MKEMFVTSKEDGSVHKVWKILYSDTGSIDVWCKDWYGHHVIGHDCEFVNQDRWVSVEDVLPEPGIIVLCVVSFSQIRLIGRIISGDWYLLWYDGEQKSNISDVTHWQPLPSPPQTSTNNTK